MCEFKFTGKYEHKKHDKTKIGETKFIKEQFEEGVEKKLKSAPDVSLFKIHKRK
jgi:hypothetical protein